MKSITLPATACLKGEVQIPGSKSISNRALLLSSLARGTTQIRNLLMSDDIEFMLAALSKLGVDISTDDPDVWADTDTSSPGGKRHTVTGRAGPLVTRDVDLSLDLGLAGTALRPLAAALTLGHGTFTLDGTPRMRERPIGPLVDGLRQLGAVVEYCGNEGYPPLKVTGTGLSGGHATMAGNLSSQFLTSLLMTAPLAGGPVVIDVEGDQVSQPYLAITMHMMSQFGVEISHRDFQHFEITPATYQSPGEFYVESDASSASYYLAAGAIAGPGLQVKGVGSQSVQGDIAFIDVLKAMGAKVDVFPNSVFVAPGSELKAIDMDLNGIPDAAMTAAVLALFADGTSTIRNIYNWRVKETDRLEAMCRELRKLGATVIEGRDFLSITPPQSFTQAQIDTYGDHRIAMCFSLACLGGVSVEINDPDCVSKTFPTYFELFSSAASL